jgi:signal transduction histidine kinase/CheY-like chemotaxis protein
MQSEGENWLALQASMVAWMAAGICFVSWLLWWMAIIEPLTFSITGLSLILFGGGLIIWRHIPHSPAVAAVSLVLGTLLLAWFAQNILLIPDAGYFYLIPCLMAALLWGHWPALLCTLISGALIWQNAGALGQPTAAATPLILLVAFASLCLPAFAAMRATLRQAWAYGEQRSTLAHEVQVHRGEVSRLNKSLGLAHALLQRHARELAAARQEAERARQMKEQFAVYTSHELRTPLNIILGFLEIMQGYPETYGEVHWTPALRQDIAEIRSSARYLSELVNDLLDLARIDALKMPMRRESSQIEEVIQDAVEITRRLLQDKPVTMQVYLDGPLPPIFIDRARIRQVLLNLLANAGRFTQQGEISIRAQVTENSLIVAVADTGAGIPPAQLETLFQDYHQRSLEDVGTRDGKGLGLAIAKQFVLMHGGQIWVESQPGVGSTFFFTLPYEMIQIGRLHTSSDVGKPAQGQAPHVIVLDPDDAAAAYLRRRLEGYTICDAKDWAQAETLVRKFHPQALLYNMPPSPDSLNRLPAAELVQTGVPLIRCSLPVGAWRLEHEQFDRWLVKPLSSERLLQTIEQYCLPGARLLLVDDDRSFIQLVRRMLQADGNRFHLSWASDGEVALQLLHTERFDLVLLDIALPLRNGRAVVQAIRADQKLSHLPVVAVSGYLPGLDPMPAQPHTFALTVANGFSEVELMALLEATLQQVSPRYGALSPAGGSPPDLDVTAACAASPLPPVLPPVLDR